MHFFQRLRHLAAKIEIRKLELLGKNVQFGMFKVNEKIAAKLNYFSTFYAFSICILLGIYNLQVLYQINFIVRI